MVRCIFFRVVKLIFLVLMFNIYYLDNKFLNLKKKYFILILVIILYILLLY